MLMCAWSRLLQQPPYRRCILLVGLRGRLLFSSAASRPPSGIPGSSSRSIRASHRLVSLQRLAEKADGANHGNNGSTTSGNTNGSPKFTLSKRSINAAATANDMEGSRGFINEECPPSKESIKKQGLGYFSAGLGLAVLFLGTGLMIPIGRNEEISVSSVENAAMEVGRRIFLTLESIAGKVGTFTIEVLDAMSTAVVLLKCLKSVLESYGEGVTKGWWRAKVAAFLADVSAAGGDRRRAMLSAGDGAVVDWLLETAAKSQGPGSMVTQGEAARALSYLLEDETTCESVLARPHSLPNLLKFSASLPANLRPRTYRDRKKLSDVGSSRGKSQLVAAIMEIVTASCETNDEVFRPKLPGTANPIDIAAALGVIEEGCSQLVEDPKEQDDHRGRGQGIGMKLVGGTGLIGLQMVEHRPFFRWIISVREALRSLVSGHKVSFGLVDRHHGKDLVGYGLWDDLQGRFVAVPLAAWAVATWAESSIANRNYIVKLDKDGLALMAAVQAPERTVKWHGARTMRMLLENMKTVPRDEVILEWSSALLDLAVQSCTHEDSALVQEALSAFTSCFKEARLAHLPALDKAFPVMRALAQQTAQNVNIQRSIARAVDVFTESGQSMPAEESRNWSGILLRWISSRASDKTTQTSASAVLSKVVNSLGEASIPVSQTLLALMLVDLVKYGRPEPKSPATVSKEAKAKGLLQTQVLQSAVQAATNLGKVVSLEGRAQVAISGTASRLPLTDLLGAEYVPPVVTKNGGKEQVPKVTVNEAATAVSKAVKALTDLSAEDQVFQRRIIDSGGLCLLRRLMLSDDYEQWFAADASSETDTRTEAVKEKEAAEVAAVASHIRKHAARLLTVLTRHPQVARAISNDKAWISWLEDCAAGKIEGCNDLKSLSYAQMVLLNVAQSQQQNVKGFGRDLFPEGVWPRYEDMIFLLYAGESKASKPESEAEAESKPETKDGSEVGNGAKPEVKAEADTSTVQKDVDSVRRDEVGSGNTVHNASEGPLMDVIFIHGLAGGPIKSWRVSDDKTSTTGKSGLIESIDEQAGREGTCWPYEWLSADLPRSRLISVKYKTNFSEWSGATLPIEEVGSMLLDKLLAAGVGERPVVFITHSMGGLVVKQMLLQASKDKSRSHLVDNASGVVFYSCPHFGSKLADMPWRMGYVLRPAPSVAELRSGSPRLEELNRCVRNLHYRGTLQVLSFSETKVTPLVEGYGGWALRMEVVPIESAYPGFGELVVLDGTDHVNSCKPLSPSDPAYTKTLEFLRKIEAKLRNQQ